MGGTFLKNFHIDVEIFFTLKIFEKIEKFFDGS